MSSDESELFLDDGYDVSYFLSFPRYFFLLHFFFFDDHSDDYGSGSRSSGAYSLSSSSEISVGRVSVSNFVVRES